MHTCLFSFSKTCTCIVVRLDFEDSCFLNGDGLHPLAIVDVVLLAEVLYFIDVV
jgi:hypothetical protein